LGEHVYPIQMSPNAEDGRPLPKPDEFSTTWRLYRWRYVFCLLAISASGGAQDRWCAVERARPALIGIAGRFLCSRTPAGRERPQSLHPDVGPLPAPRRQETILKNDAVLADAIRCASARRPVLAALTVIGRAHMGPSPVSIPPCSAVLVERFELMGREVRRVTCRPVRTYDDALGDSDRRDNLR
jgi:hypothetical protein